MPLSKASTLPHASRRLSGRHQWSANHFKHELANSPDIERQRHFDTTEDEDEDSDSSGLTSRSPAGPQQPMLGRVARRSPAVRRKVSAYTHTLDRRKCNRYFALGLGSLMIFFMVTLVWRTQESRRVVETVIVKPPPRAPLFNQFPFLKRYHGGIRTLVSRADNIPEYPGDEEETLELLRSTSLATDAPSDHLVRRTENYTIPNSRPFDPFVIRPTGLKECFLDADAKLPIPKLHAYDGVPQGFPDSVMGSHDTLGLNADVCFERYGRLGPYGYGYSQKLGGSGAGMEGDREGAELVWKFDSEVDYTNINWARAQVQCHQANQHRFEKTSASRNNHRQITERMNELVDGLRAEPDRPASKSDGKASKHDATTDTPRIPRQAVVIRTWSDFNYDAEDIMYLRALISELALVSGTEYVVHILLHVKDNDLPIWSDDTVYQRVLNDSLPEEFRGLATLWSEKQMSLIYAGLQDTNFRDLGVYGVYRSTFMPMQYFAHQHPEYDFFWHWEMDIRYTGHFYHLFNQVSQWAREQPRKGLWERNSRFYVPSHHGTWEDFRQMVRVQTEHGTGVKSIKGAAGRLWGKLGRPGGKTNNEVKITVEKPIWGPETPVGDILDVDDDPQPPTTYDKDKYEWGVGEDADLITFNPLFDPDQTGWILADDVTGYDPEKNGLPPRRTAIITATRLSRKLLDTMHRETALKHHTMFSEMWPGSCALHHGLKAVYVPHPVYIDRRWPTDYLAATFNAGRNGASGGSRTSVFEDNNQRNFLGVTWYYHSGFPVNLFNRWLGKRVDGDGGEEEELAGEGRMCLPPMLLHPIKQVDLVYEQSPEPEPETLPTMGD